MGDWATLFKNFIYRDVAFVLGGSIVLGTVAHYLGLFHLKDLHESWPAPSIILLVHRLTSLDAQMPVLVFH